MSAHELLDRMQGTSQKVYIIEHMEEDASPAESASSVPAWVFLEYTHIAKNVRAIFSSLSSSSASSLSKTLHGGNSIATTTGIDELLEGRDRDRFCLLDPRATEALSPEDASRFDALLFGGILGDHPPRDRTSELRRLKLPSRHLGPMTTDTAVLVSQLVLEKGQRLEDIAYLDQPEIKLNEHESIEMPFRYIKTQDGEPLLPDGMREHLYKDLDRGFDELQ